MTRFADKKPQPPARICAQKGCKTVLSRYNTTDWCSVHAAPRRGDNEEIQARKRRQGAPRNRGTPK